jgi:hypothetical protein
MGSECMKTPGTPTRVTVQRCVMVRPDKTAVQDSAIPTVQTNGWLSRTIAQVQVTIKSHKSPVTWVTSDVWR